jgi:hypothetical protein
MALGRRCGKEAWGRSRRGQRWIRSPVSPIHVSSLEGRTRRVRGDLTHPVRRLVVMSGYDSPSSRGASPVVGAGSPAPSSSTSAGGAKGKGKGKGTPTGKGTASGKEKVGRK